MTLFQSHVKLMRSISWVDIVLLAGLFLFIYALVGVAHEWTGPYRSRIEIDLSLSALPRYGFFSMIRGFVAYGLSLLFAIGYGYVAARSRRSEIFLIPFLDVLQSIPVMGFLPGLVLVLVNLFPGTNLGLEFASVLMIFTSQAWNMTMSFYSSVKGVPADLREMASLFRLKRWDVLRNVEIPYAMNGLLWNSMLSMAGGWFFLMVSESFTLGERDFRLPGLGSYMTVAIEKRDGGAILAGIVTMTLIIVLVDRCFWAPIVIWSERFKGERDSSIPVPKSLVFEWFQRSKLVRQYYRFLDQAQKRIKTRKKSLTRKLGPVAKDTTKNLRLAFRLSILIGVMLAILTLILGVRGLYHLLAATAGVTWILHLRDTFFTLLRVTVAVVLGSLWTIPVGVWIGTNPIWTQRLQPVVQVVAAFPAPMIFPLATLFLANSGISFEIGSMLLMLLGSQWYILFNVISGAMLIPRQMLDLGKIFHVRGLAYWKSIILPSIFPSLLTGWFTAAGGAWNASIVTEYVSYGKEVQIATGIGASITRAAHTGDFPSLAGGIVTMVMTVVLLNYLVWRELYRLAETRFKLGD